MIVTPSFRVVLFIAAWVACSIVAAEVPRAEPAEVGLSAEKLARIDALFNEEVKKGELAGIVVLVARHGKVVHLSAIGSADIARKAKLQTDSIFRLYSMTKAISATALMTLYEEGRFQLTQPLSDFIPEFKNLRVLRTPDAAFTDTVELQRAPTIQDSLRHTTGFTHGIMGDAFDKQYVDANYFGLDVTLTGMMTKLSHVPLRYQPGTRWEYSVGPDIDARLVEILSGKPFDEYLEEHIFKPLGMQDTAFWLKADKAKRLATVYSMKKTGKLTALDAAYGNPSGWVITDPALVNSYSANHPRKGGSYGLVGTAEDYWRFAQMILNGGELNGVRVLGPRTVQYMLSDQLKALKLDVGPGMSFGLGFGLITDPAGVGYISSAGNALWSGAAATEFRIDPKEDLVLIAMTQHFDVPAAMAIMPQISAIVYGAIEK